MYWWSYSKRSSPKLSAFFLMRAPLFLLVLFPGLTSLKGFISFQRPRLDLLLNFAYAVASTITLAATVCSLTLCPLLSQSFSIWTNSNFKGEERVRTFALLLQRDRIISRATMRPLAYPLHQRLEHAASLGPDSVVSSFRSVGVTLWN